MADFLQLQRKVAWFGLLNSLSQVLLKFSSPGVPDLFQGTELWDLSLVDPDNRRPVDYAARAQMLTELKELSERPNAFVGDEVTSSLISELLVDWPRGRIKMFLIARLLEFRRANRQLFQGGKYLPLSVLGPKSEHVCAFARTTSQTTALVIAPRLPVTLLGGQTSLPVGDAIWMGTVIRLHEISPDRPLRNVFTGEFVSVKNGELKLNAALKTFPLALMSIP